MKKIIASAALALAIGGSDMQDLLVTTARQGMTDPDPAQGLPYLTRAPAPGLPEPKVIL